MEVEYKTRQRALILQFLSDNRERHLSVDEVFDYLHSSRPLANRRCTAALTGS